MFDGESVSLKAIAETNTLHVPKPLHVLDNPEGGAVLVLEYLDMKGLTRYSRQLGEELAKMHLHNAALGKKQQEQESYVGGQEDEDGEKPVYMDRFGFEVTTCCGYLPQDNTFCDDWPTFYARQRLDHQLKLIEKDYGDKEVRELWSRLQHKVPNFFKDLTIEPALLHGDLWGGNVAESATGPEMHASEDCGNEALPYRMVARLISAFRTGRNETTHVARIGRPSICDEQVQLVRGLLAVDHRWTVRELSIEVERWDWEVLEHPLYSPDMSPCDYDLFPQLKEPLRGKRFPDIASVHAVGQSIREIDRNNLANNIQRLPQIWQKIHEHAVVFDPASFYGHHEFELAIAGMFGGFNSTFYQAYHNLIPKAPGFEARHKLYQLYHYLNHWLVLLTYCCYVLL
ncbi:hypothetical protein ANN_07331, partial [Periplaneta americana]